MFLEWEVKGCGVRATLLGSVESWEYFPHGLHEAGAGAGKPETIV